MLNVHSIRVAGHYTIRISILNFNILTKCEVDTELCVWNSLTSDARWEMRSESWAAYVVWEISLRWLEFRSRDWSLFIKSKSFLICTLRLLETFKLLNCIPAVLQESLVHMVDSFFECVALLPPFALLNISALLKSRSAVADTRQDARVPPYL